MHVKTVKKYSKKMPLYSLLKPLIYLIVIIAKNVIQNSKGDMLNDTN